MFLENFWADYFNALLITIIPGLVLLILFFFRDKIREPFHMVISTFAMAFIITLPLDILIQIVDPLLLAYFDNAYYYSFQSFFRAAYLEEVLKFSILFYYVGRHHEFDEFIDGAVYGAAIGLGYAVTENLGYMYFHDGYDYTYSDLAIARITPMIAHTFFGIIMGVLFSKSVFQIIKNNAGIYLALFIPVFVHGIHNYSISSKTIPYLPDFFVGAGIIVILFFLSSMTSIKNMYNEKPKIELTNLLFLSVVFSGLIFSIALSFIFGNIG